MRELWVCVDLSLHEEVKTVYPTVASQMRNHTKVLCRKIHNLSRVPARQSANVGQFRWVEMSQDRHHRRNRPARAQDRAWLSHSTGAGRRPSLNVRGEGSFPKQIALRSRPGPLHTPTCRRLECSQAIGHGTQFDHHPSVFRR